MTPLEQQNALETMPPRERECLRLAAQRVTRKEAARLLNISPMTVRTLQRRAAERLQADGIPQAAVLLSRFEAEDPVATQWLHTTLATVRAAALVIEEERAAASHTHPPVDPAPELDDRRPAPRAPAPDEGERSDNGRASARRAGGRAAVDDVDGSAARALGHPDRGRPDARPQSGLAAGVAAWSVTNDLIRSPFALAFAAGLTLVFALAGIGAFYVMIISLQHSHEGLR